MTPKISVHCLARNEQRWIWFALMSVLDFVDEILVWDNGSTDSTQTIVRSINNPKIKIKSIGPTPPDRYSSIRQRMLDQTKADWLLILDGDEIWPCEAISATRQLIKDRGAELDFIIQPFYSLVGDLYHHLPESSGHYQIGPYRGHLTIRAMNLNKLKSLHYSGEHMKQGIYDASGTLIQDRRPEAFVYQPVKYFHTTHLPRSGSKIGDIQVSRRSQKFKYELGIPFPDSFSYPEVFFLPRPKGISDPWSHRSLSYTLKSLALTPFKTIRRLWYD